MDIRSLGAPKLNDVAARRGESGRATNAGKAKSAQISDRFENSSNLERLASALDRIRSEPAVRDDVVARARQLLADGALDENTSFRRAAEGFLDAEAF